MAEKVRLVLHVDEDAAALLDTLATPRGKGGYVSELVRQAARRRHEQHHAGILERIESKVDALLDAKI